jgi:ubiquinone/menaquinone biosynthesis C-methylase UbiE
MSGHDGYLGAVYGAKGAGEIAELYDRWAESYDAEMAKVGYRHPSICLALLCRHLEKGAAPILDAGAGTGLVGEWLGIMGYPEVDALDISEGMLAVARRKNCYRNYHLLALGGELPFVDGAYRGIISSGVFSTGHVGAEALGEIVRICSAGGIIALTVKGTLWDGGFDTAVQRLVDDGRIVVREVTDPYVSMPGETATTPSRGVVLAVR